MEAHAHKDILCNFMTCIVFNSKAMALIKQLHKDKWTKPNIEMIAK